MLSESNLSRRDFIRLTGSAVVGVSMASESKTNPLGLDDFLESRVAQCPAPGLAAAIVKGNQLVWAKGFGWANRESNIPMSADTLMNIGSISKTITATAVMQLWEAGKFDLDDDINEFLPFVVRNPGNPEVAITFRQLLTHRSSIKDGPAYGESYACGDIVIRMNKEHQILLKLAQLPP